MLKRLIYIGALSANLRAPSSARDPNAGGERGIVPVIIRAFEAITGARE